METVKLDTPLPRGLSENQGDGSAKAEVDPNSPFANDPPLLEGKYNFMFYKLN